MKCLEVLSSICCLEAFVLVLEHFIKVPIAKHLKEEKTCPLQYWSSNQSEYPNIAQVAVSVLGITASSAPVERLFSVAVKVFRPDRCRLNNETFYRLMFVHCNNKYLKD